MNASRERYRNLTSGEREILSFLAFYWLHANDDESARWYTFDVLSRELGRSPRGVKTIVRRLARCGFLFRSVTYDQDCMPAGSGYFVSKSGLEVLRQEIGDEEFDRLHALVNGHEI